MITSRKVFNKKSEYVKHFGKDLGWEVEQAEFSNLKNNNRYQTADETNEDAYPEPLKWKRIMIEKENQSVEETYFWMLHFIRYELGFPTVDKIYDVFSSTESSALFGNTGQKLSAQQDRAAQYLRGIGEMVKQLFQLVRELRVIDEKLEPYKQWKDNKSADISLKHTFINLVEQPANNPDAIYSLAQRVGFTILPDLFFNTHIFKLEDIDKEVDKGQTKEFNKVVRTVLKRKLYMYLNWKEKTERELESRRKFQLQYTRQHWKVIQMYMTWIKPYLRSARRLQQEQSHLDRAEFISGFDSTMMEIELLAKRPIGKGHYQCLLVTFQYSTKPTLTYQPQYQSQAVGHTGKVIVTVRAYGWHDKDVEAYKKMRQEEDIAMLKGLDEHIGAAFDSLGEEFEKYLAEAGDEDIKAKLDEENKEKEELEKKTQEEIAKAKKESMNFFAPLKDVAKGFQELGQGFLPQKKKQDDGPKDGRDKNKLQSAGKTSIIVSKVLIDIYKKTHGMLAK